MGGLEPTKYIKVQKTDPVRARFSEAPWMSYLANATVVVVGAGGIGSWVTMCLARIGCKVILYDADLFEVHNMGGQLVQTTQIGNNKAVSVKDTCIALVGASANIVTVAEMYTKDSPTSPIMIAAVDNMKTRRLIFDKWSNMYPDSAEALLIDGRLLAEDYQVYGVMKDRTKAYEETLFSDNEVPTENCSLKATTHCSLGITSEIISILTNHAANITTKSTDGIELRDIPFKIVKSVPNFLYDLSFEYGSTDSKEVTSDRRDVPVHIEQLPQVPV